MTIILLIVFVIGYLAIAFEHPLKINKAAPALLTGVICWIVYILFSSNKELVNEQLAHHLSDLAGILFFLMGAMTIVELIDAHDGFVVVTEKIKTSDRRILLWITSFIAFFLSAALDNLTTAIVMTTVLRKLVPNNKDRLFFVGMIIIAANAGGAWSPIGDVTTTMLWIGKQITAPQIIARLFLPSLVCLVLPLTVVSFYFKGKMEVVDDAVQSRITTNSSERNLVFFIGIISLLLIPIFKTVTHLPPYIAMMFSLGLVWVALEILHRKKDEEQKTNYSAVTALQKIDTPSILFFFGILLAIACLQSCGMLKQLAQGLDSTVHNINLIAIIIGLLSAIIDNVPLVAATMGMYDLSSYQTDHPFWHFIAYTAGTGGSCLIIGSAAGVAVMGLEKIDFIWYLKKISWLALLGYFAGAITYILTLKL